MKKGLQTVTAFGLLADVATGYPVMLSEMTILTALRTAATSAVAAKWLAPKGARVMAMIGNGAQAEFQALAFKAICGIEEVRLYDIDPAATEKCARNLAGRGLNVVPCNSAEQAILGAQIITTVTSMLAQGWVEGGPISSAPASTVASQNWAMAARIRKSSRGRSPGFDKRKWPRPTNSPKAVATRMGLRL